MEELEDVGNFNFNLEVFSWFLFNDVMICTHCFNAVEKERLELIPHTQLCGSCARLFNVGKRKKGVMVSTGKVGSEIQVLSDSCYKSQKKYLVANGAFSVIKNFSRNISV
jgi:hypothetical protein